MDSLKLFDDIKANLGQSRLAFQATLLLEDTGNLRSVSEAEKILELLKQVFSVAQELLTNHPSLESLYEKEYGRFSELQDREIIHEICFLDDYLFPSTENYPLIVEDNTVLDELLQNYFKSFKDWADFTLFEHEKTQTLVKEKFNTELKPLDLSCQCIKCIADYRTKMREELFKEQVKIIDAAEEELHDFILVRKINEVSDFVAKFKKKLEKHLHNARYKMKRSSLNKLEADIKAHYKSKFSPKSELGLVYREKLMAFFNSVLDEEGIKPDLIEPQEYDRFFTLLSVGIWKNASALKREFQKFIKSVLAFKRKDISATILKNYLGQFWLHAEVRKKTRRIIYHMGPTNSGKTYHAIEALSKARNGSYLAPLRLLAGELYDTLTAKGVATTLLTGEEVIESPGATHYSSTIEMAKLHEEFDCCVIDEIQMITDPQRGWAWTRALVNMNADEVHLCGDSSVLDLVKQILKLTGDVLEVNEYKRKTELAVESRPIRLNELKQNDALIVFSRRNALKYKMDLENLGFKVSIVYGRLSPEVRREQARKFDVGETDIIVSTDAIAMGMNLPVKRIVFSALSKFIDNKEFPLSPSEIKQIAGRAGRFQRFPKGTVTVLPKVDGGLEIIEEALSLDLEQKEVAMVGPDLEIFQSVNAALDEHGLPILSLSEFLRLFNTMTFVKPFYCVDLKEMVEIAEMVENADPDNRLSLSEKFGFACAPVNLGLIEHVQYYVWILTHYVKAHPIVCETIDDESNDIDYLETSIKCVELYQWLARHFDNKNFEFKEEDILENKARAIEKLNTLLSEKTSKKCSSCGCNLPDDFRFNICENCFGEKRSRFRGRRPEREEDSRAPRARGGKGTGRSTKKYDKPKAGASLSRSSSGGAKKNKASAFKKHR